MGEKYRLDHYKPLTKNEKTDKTDETNDESASDTVHIRTYR